MVAFWLFCYIFNQVVQDEWSGPKPVGNYWLNPDTARILEMKSFNYETKMIEYRETKTIPDSVTKTKFYVKSKETDIMNSDIDFYELYEYYHD